MTEALELWKRNPVELVRELIGNPAFKESLRYAPERILEKLKGKVSRRYSEMWTADWWWETQVRQHFGAEGATIAPVIIASDKTQLSTFSGDKSAWPVYLTIGNNEKEVRRKPSQRATLLLGYIPVSKLECFSKPRRSIEANRLFHSCMRKLLQPLVDAGNEGVRMVCADGGVRVVYPLVAAYIADHPEQCLVACVKESKCPRCTVATNERGSPVYSVLRDPDETIALLQQEAAGIKTDAFRDLGLKPIIPFWIDLPYCDIFSCITPDILHQLHKGVFKDHLVSWTTKAMSLVVGKGKGADELDARYKSVPDHASLRHFRRGISLVSQWTGHEYKDMQKVFLGILAGSVDENVIRAVRSVLDFIQYAHFEEHSDESLDEMDASWLDFHRYKKIFIELGIRDAFNIAKVHSMRHYIDSIRSRGSADGFNTEGTERLHIDLAKLGYRASNRKQYLRQMTRWLERQESVHWYASYLQWAVPGYVAEIGRIPDDDEEDGEQDDEEVIDQAEEVDEEGDDAPEVERAPQLSSMPALSDASYSVPSLPVKIAKKASLRVSVADMESRYGAVNFLWTLSDFLRQSALAPLPAVVTQRTSFPVFKRFYLQLPLVDAVSSTRTKDTIRATPHQPRSGLRAAVPARYDTVLIREKTPSSSLPQGHPLYGLRVGQVRVIFRLPDGVDCFTQTLAYVQWFTPFRDADSLYGMHTIKRSTRNHSRYASIIPLSDIVRSCLLLPIPPTHTLPSTWTSDNVLDECTAFRLNPYLRHDDFYVLRFISSLFRKDHRPP
ncbi:uncharacterized protein STEHIDRAFT_64969 [Stereum hirsutum FP-91666 SS1]|uniref:uncharacterized protein n=1 Tax=Stereum hirsutum (strain FP-91666) TaxID=721885 RepID=UPI000444A644|nr:uncharacterized protein STEHIDRAFT_64969 [Stereum hirsutum FP-91666 SS1]EIM82509.1 hypothetical protein STEHIDRAFT_64969 [Stereum hirsutum FP-91666 SS1]